MCTHGVMSRLYNEDGKYRCQLPHCRKSDRWLYHCVQDHNGCLPNPATNTPDLSDRVAKFSLDENADIELNDWVLYAIENDHYTDEQIKRLIDQRDGVKFALLGVAERAPTPSTSSETSQSSTMEDNNTTPTSIASAVADEELRQSIEMDPKEVEANASHRHRNTTFADNNNFFTSAPHSPCLELRIPLCTFKCCHSCRPAYRDRAYISLNSFLNTPITAPPQWDLENRPVSNADIVKQLGIPKPPPASKTYEAMCREVEESFDRKWSQEQQKWDAITRRRRRSEYSTGANDFEDRLQAVFKRLKGRPTKPSPSRMGYHEDQNPSRQSLPLPRTPVPASSREWRSATDPIESSTTGGGGGGGGGGGSTTVPLPRSVSSTIFSKRWSTSRTDDERSIDRTSREILMQAPLAKNAVSSKENRLNNEGRTEVESISVGGSGSGSGRGETGSGAAQIISQV